MENMIIILILIVVIFLGIRESVKHFRGEGGCCGGSPSKPPKKRLRNQVIKTYIFQIEGMHCQNCANTVTRSINEMDGAAAKINLKKHEAKIFCDREIDALSIKNAIERKGYKVTGIVCNGITITVS